ncbi:MAG: DUF4019 domain-containing protein, partial [Pyrinomonadaceae bacterium]
MSATPDAATAGRAAQASGARRRMVPAVVLLTALVVAAAAGVACDVDERRSGLPTGAQEAIDRLTDDIAAGRYDKIYTEAADEWRRAATPEQSEGALSRVRDRLGRVESRALHTGREQESAGGELPGRSLVASFQTKFERGAGMETFTLVERDGRWLLAR